MEHLEFEPFGERVTQDNSLRQESRASRWLLWTGSAVFWSLVATIVLARAVYFDPAVFANFGRIASLARNVF